MLHQASVALDELRAIAGTLHDDLAPALGNVGPANEISEDDAGAGARGAGDLAEQGVDRAIVEPLTDVRECEAVDRSCRTRAEVFRDRSVNQRQRLRRAGGVRNS